VVVQISYTCRCLAVSSKKQPIIRVHVIKYFIVRQLQGVNRRKEQQVIFLKNKKAFKNKHLMATADGKLLHNGGNGKWARFVVEYPPVDDGKTQIKLRAVGRSQVRGGQNSFVGVVEKEGQQVPCGSVVSDDQSANLTVDFV